MSIFDNLPNPAAPGQAFMAGMERARAQREDQEMRGALTAYALNPDDDKAFAGLAQYRPDLAIQIGEDRTKRQQAARVADLQRRAASGDRASLAELAGIDLNAWDKLTDNERTAADDRASAIGQSALRISQLPPEQRPIAWDQAIDQLAQRYPELAEYKGQYSEEALMGAIDNAKLVNDFFELERPRYQVIPEGGTMVDTSNPAAVQSFVGGGAAPVGGQQGQFTFEMYQGLVREGGPQNAASWLERTQPVVSVATPAEARRLPSGTRILLPDGTEGRVP